MNPRQFPSETVVQRCSVTKVFLKILQNSKENTCARVSFLKRKLQAFYTLWKWMWSIYKHASSTTEAAPEMVFFKKGVVKNFAKFLHNKVPGLHVTLLKRRLRHRCFSVNFSKFLRTLFFYKTPPGDCFCSKHPHSGNSWL